MLVRKKILIKKLAIYLAIIFFMLGGAGFMLYLNKKLAANKSTNVNSPIVFNNSAPAAANNQAAAEPSQVLDTNKLNQSGGFNLNIFSSDKFKNLRASTLLIKERSEVGKRDPFKPN